MPVLGMHVRERPGDAVPAQSRAHMRVVEHVKGIVVVDELVVNGLPENRPRYRKQENGDPQDCHARIVHAVDLAIQRRLNVFPNAVWLRPADRSAKALRLENNPRLDSRAESRAPLYNALWLR